MFVVLETSIKGDTTIEQSHTSQTIGDITNQVTLDKPVNRQKEGIGCDYY